MDSMMMHRQKYDNFVSLNKNEETPLASESLVCIECPFFVHNSCDQEDEKRIINYWVLFIFINTTLFIHKDNLTVMWV